MRAALRANPGLGQVSVGRSIPAPIGGWDASSPLAAMPIENAQILDNWIPRAGYVELRRGFVAQQTGFSSPVETLMAYRGGAGGDLLFAAAGGAIYDVTQQGAGVGAPLYSGAASNRWTFTSFANPAGAWLIACNGFNAPIGYNGSSWAALPALTTSGIVPLNPNALFNVFPHKGRLYFLEKGCLRVWFAGPAAVGGDCGLLDLSSIFSKGGRLVCGGAWSAQMGLTLDDFAVFMTDQGQLAVYQVADPTDAGSISLLGVFDLGPPLGPRALMKFGGDLAVVTADGVIPLSQALKLDRSQQNEVALTAKILNAFSVAVKAFGGNYGWQGLLYPGTSPSDDADAAGGSLAIFNVPLAPPPWSAATSYGAGLQVLGSDGYIYASLAGSNLANNPVTDGGTHWRKLAQGGGSNVQFVQNVLTGAWCRFLNLDAYCWELAGGRIYFGGANGVYQWDAGSSDNGVAIVGDIKSAFTDFGDRGRQKRFTMIRPLLNTTPLVQPALEIDVDYQESEPTAVATVVEQGATAAQIRYDWTSASGIGYVGAARMQVNLVGDPSTPTLSVGDLPEHELGIDGAFGTLFVRSNLPFDVPCQLLGFDIVYEPGGQL